MPKFKSTKELMAYLQKRVDQVLTEDVFPVVQKEEVKAVDDVVYSMATSGYYQWRYEYGGIGDPYNIVIKGGAAKNGIMSVVNETEPNPYLNGRNGARATVNKSLPYVIEHGVGQSGDPGYDYWKRPKARPFTATTIARLDASGEHVIAMKNGLRKHGIKVR